MKCLYCGAFFSYIVQPQLHPELHQTLENYRNQLYSIYSILVTWCHTVL